MPDVAGFRREFAAPVLQGRRALSVVGEGEEVLLAVRDVAARLGMCTATVYRLVGEGQLGHVRILNAIRVAARDLEAFIAERRRGGQGGDPG